MSFDLNLVCLKDGEPDVFPADIVRQAFEPFVKSRDEDLWTLEFPDGGGGEMSAYGAEETETSDISISRASGADIYDALYKVLQQTHTVLIWSFGGCVVANEAVIPDLPEGLIESLGTPAIVNSGADILSEIAKT
jgi:hypothetical protein